MKNLIPIIGHAPSEISRQELLERIEREHIRVADSLNSWIPPAEIKKAAKKKKARKKKVDPAVTAAVRASGMTTAEILKAVAAKVAKAKEVKAKGSEPIYQARAAPPPAKSFKELTPGTLNWKIWWEMHPEDQKEMLIKSKEFYEGRKG